MQNRDCLGDLVVLLIKRAPFELEMIKKGSSAWGSGVSVWSGRGSQQRWQRVITDRVCAVSKLGITAGAAATQPLLFIRALRRTIHKCAARFAAYCVVVLSSPFPGHAAATPLSLCRCWWRAEKSMRPHWDERNLVSDNLGSSCIWIIHSPGEAVANAVAEVYYRQRISRLYHITALISET